LALLAGCGGKEASPTGPSAPAYSLSGTVRDGGNQNLLAGVTVRLTGDASTREVITSFEGAGDVPDYSSGSKSDQSAEYGVPGGRIGGTGINGPTANLAVQFDW